MSVDVPSEDDQVSQALSQDRIRHLITRSVLRAASAVTAPDLEPQRRLATLMECHAAVAAARGPLVALPFADFRALITAGRDERTGRSALAFLLPDGVEPLDLETVWVLDDDGRVSDEAFDVELEQRMLLQTLRKLGAEAGAVSDQDLQSEVEQETAYTLLSKQGNQKMYVNGRTDLIEHPAGSVEQLSELRLPPLVAAFYEDIGYGSQYRGWWFACPVCRWPMRIAVRRDGPGTVGSARCWHAPHTALGAAYLFDVPEPGVAPVLRPELFPQRPGPREAVLFPAFDGVPAALPTAGHKAVVRGIWRYTTVPGRPELDLRNALAARGLDVELWPAMDAYDLLVRVGKGPKKKEFKVDVKDYTSAATLGKLIHAQEGDSGGAKYLVVPDYRSVQVPLLSGVCARYDGMQAMTTSDFGAMVCAAAGVVWA